LVQPSFIIIKKEQYIITKTSSKGTLKSRYKIQIQVKIQMEMQLRLTILALELPTSPVIERITASHVSTQHALTATRNIKDHALCETTIRIYAGKHLRNVGIVTNPNASKH